MKGPAIRIGGASGYWGDSQSATEQLLASGNVDYVVYDYLAEITMSIMARARAKDPDAGYAPDFVSSAMAPNLNEISKQGVRIISNAGGINPLACAKALEQEISKAGLPLKVACITGDDLIDQAETLSTRGIVSMFGDEKYPESDTIASINVYTGAFAIARALNMGVDIVITGRCVDSAVTLGACIHSFGWKADDFDKLSSGSLAGHIIECGAQATGGNFTDWHLCADTMENIGYPIVEVHKCGDFNVTKPEGSGGLVSVGSVSEQIVYEIGNPQDYQLPDVICDFSHVKLEQADADTVSVCGARGLTPPEKLKASITWQNGFRGGQYLTFYGADADQKAQSYCAAVFRRCEDLLNQSGLPRFSHTSVEIIGAESQFGVQAHAENVREVCVKVGARHECRAGIALFLREITALVLSGPPGISGFAGTRSRPSPVIALFSCLLPREDCQLAIHMEGELISFSDPAKIDIDAVSIEPIPFPEKLTPGETVGVPLVKLAFARSGDKGDKANIGVIARDAKFLPYICQQLSEDVVARLFAHFLRNSGSENVTRYFLPGLGAINFVLDSVLDGGGTSSLRNDPQAKGYGQLLLVHEIQIPVEMADGLL